MELKFIRVFKIIDLEKFVEEERDFINYTKPAKPSFGFLGSVANMLLIKKQLKGIFDYLTIAVEKMFGKME